MKSKTYRSLGLDVAFQVPESVEEFDTNAKRVGACLDEGTNNVVYRGSLAEFRDSFCEKLEAAFAIERKTEDTGKKDAKGETILKYTETEAEFKSRLAATKGWDETATITNLQPIANEVASAIVFDASATERKASAPKKLSQEYRGYATTILSSPNRDKGVATITAATGKTWTATGDTEKDTESLGWLCKEYASVIAKQTMAGVTG